MKKLNLFMIIFVPTYFACDIWILSIDPRLTFDYLVAWIFSLGTIAFFPMYLDNYITLCSNTSKHVDDTPNVNHCQQVPFHYLPVDIASKQ